mgnify:FL=1
MTSRCYIPSFFTFTDMKKGEENHKIINFINRAVMVN